MEGDIRSYNLQQHVYGVLTAEPLNSSTETLLLDVSDSTRFSGLLTREFVRTYQAFRSPSTAWNNQKAATYEVNPPFQPNESEGKVN